MAKKPKTYEPEAEYKLQLNRVVPFGTLKLRPGDANIRLRGKHCTEIDDAIESAEKIAKG